SIRGLTGTLQVNVDAIKEWVGQVKAAGEVAKEKFLMDIGPAIAGTIANIASSLGAATQSMENFGAAILSSIGGFMQQFGASLVAMGIGAIALEKFSGPAMIAAGLALSALGGSLQASASRHSRSSSRDDGIALSPTRASSTFRASSSVQDSRPELVTVIKGEDIWITLQNYQRNNHFVHG